MECSDKSAGEESKERDVAEPEVDTQSLEVTQDVSVSSPSDEAMLSSNTDSSPRPRSESQGATSAGKSEQKGKRSKSFSQVRRKNTESDSESRSVESSSPCTSPRRSAKSSTDEIGEAMARAIDNVHIDDESTQHSDQTTKRRFAALPSRFALPAGYRAMKLAQGHQIPDSLPFIPHPSVTEDQIPAFLKGETPAPTEEVKEQSSETESSAGAGTGKFTMMSESSGTPSDEGYAVHSESLKSSTSSYYEESKKDDAASGGMSVLSQIPESPCQHSPPFNPPSITDDNPSVDESSGEVFDAETLTQDTAHSAAESELPEATAAPAAPAAPAPSPMSNTSEQGQQGTPVLSPDTTSDSNPLTVMLDTNVSSTIAAKGASAEIPEDISGQHEVLSETAGPLLATADSSEASHIAADTASSDRPVVQLHVHIPAQQSLSSEVSSTSPSTSELQHQSPNNPEEQLGQAHGATANQQPDSSQSPSQNTLEVASARSGRSSPRKRSGCEHSDSDSPSPQKHSKQ